MEDAFKVKPMTAKVMTSSKLLMSMKAGELSEFLVNSGTIPVSIDLTKLKSLCAVSKEAETELEMVLPEAPAPIGLEDLNEAYAFFFTARTTLKQSLAAEKARAAYTGEMPAMNAAAIEKRLNEILAQEARVKAQQSQVDAYRAACVKRQKANEEMVKLGQKIKEITAKAPEPGAKEQLEKQMQEVQDRINSRSSTLLVLKKNVETLEKTLKALDTSYCPLSDKLVCKTDKSAVKEEISETVRAAQEEIARNRTGAERAENTRCIAGSQAEAAQGRGNGLSAEGYALPEVHLLKGPSSRCAGKNPLNRNPQPNTPKKRKSSTGKKR